MVTNPMADASSVDPVINVSEGDLGDCTSINHVLEIGIVEFQVASSSKTPFNAHGPSD